MGEREIVEQVEVTDEEKVYLCDFCGRSSDEFDERFKYVYTNPDVTVPSFAGITNGNTIYNGNNTEIKYRGWRKEVNVTVKGDNEQHYCPECHKAHVEVHDDDN